MVIHYKCPNCGSDMSFDSESGKLSCGNCGRQDNIESFSDEFIETVFEEDEAKEYHCNNCGAVLVTDADTTATKCSFCGAAVVLADRVSGILAPSLVIPFTINKEQAIEAFKKWCRNGRLTPRGFMTANRIKEITGMYVPFWVYDLNSKAKISAVGTKVRTYSRGDYIYTETKFYDVYRDLDINFSRVPADASEKMDDELMDKLEPYDYGSFKDFKTPYLAGYIAEKYNYDDKELLPRVQEKMSGSIDNYIRSTISGYTSVNYKNRDIHTKNAKSLYVLLPVWMLYYDYDKAEHIFAMNGQTGKVVGKPPLSMGKIAAWFGGIAGSTFILMKIITYIVSGGGILF
ncbi:TFIIB-type zinc ribbon-containing protein [Oceanobacillus sp. CAU 1775]